MAFNATFNNTSVISWRKPKKTADLPQVTYKIYHIMLYIEHTSLSKYRLQIWEPVERRRVIFFYKIIKAVVDVLVNHLLTNPLPTNFDKSTS